MDCAEFKLIVEHFDELAGLNRSYVLTYFDSSPPQVSIFDTGRKRMFLKRTVYNDIGLKDLFKDAIVTVYGRQYKVKDYADRATREFFTKDQGLVEVVVPAEAYNDFGNALVAAQRNGFNVTKLKTEVAPKNMAGPIQLCMVLSGDIASARTEEDLWDCVFRGATQPGLRGVRVSFPDEYTDEKYQSNQTTATFDNCALLVIKPHAVKAGYSGEIVASLLEANFEISAAQMFCLQRNDAENFLEVYKGVIAPSDFSAVTLDLSNGPCIAIEVRAENAVPELRELCGPSDVEVAKALRPNTLRARFGTDRIHNAVHCTDLPEDGVLESQFFFDIMVNTSSQRHK